MTLLILIEAFKIHKVKQERRVQFWFLFLYIVNILPWVLPVGDKNFDPLLAAVEATLAGRTAQAVGWDLLSPGNRLFLGLMFLSYLITAFFTLMYSVLYIDEKEGSAGRPVFVRCLKTVPQLIMLTAIIAIPAAMSAMLAFIPLIVFVFMMYFLPLHLVFGQKKLFNAMQLSFDTTRGKKLSIFLRVFLVSFVLSVPQSILSQLVSGNQLSYTVLNTFFVVIQALVQGRLMGILYLQLVKKVPFMIPSNSNVSGKNHDQEK